MAHGGHHGFVLLSQSIVSVLDGLLLEVTEILDVLSQLRVNIVLIYLVHIDYRLKFLSDVVTTSDKHTT